MRSPTLSKRRLSAQLRRLREDTGLTALEVAQALGWSKSKVTYVERNDWERPNHRDVEDLLKVYRVTDPDLREEMISLARGSRQRGWLYEYRDILGMLAEAEADASSIRSYGAMVIQGLLQTPAYTAALFEGTDQRRVAARMARQAIFDRARPPAFSAVIDEAALSRMIGGPAVMREQAEHLIAMSHRPGVEIQILPFEIGAHGSVSGPFTIFTYEETGDEPIVYVETAAGDLYLEAEKDLSRFTLKYDHVREKALNADATRDYLSSMVTRLT